MIQRWVRVPIHFFHGIDRTIDFWIVAKIIDAFMKIGFEPVMNGERCVRGARLVTPAIFKYSLR